MRLCFSDEAWTDYLWWQEQDSKTLKKIHHLFKELQRHPKEGTGQPELLRGNLSGAWSRRIDSKNRLVYIVLEDRIDIIGLRSHYGDH